MTHACPWGAMVITKSVIRPKWEKQRVRMCHLP